MCASLDLGYVCTTSYFFFFLNIPMTHTPITSFLVLVCVIFFCPVPVEILFVFLVKVFKL